MGYNSKLTRKTILEYAKKEFLEFGFQRSSMRHIAELANVTTGAMYNHFVNKEQLFDTLVKDPADKMISKFEGLLKNALRTSSDSKDTDLTLSDQSNLGTDWMLEFIYEHMDSFRLIFCCAEGTHWSTYLNDLIEIEEKYYRIYFNNICSENNKIEDIFLHITVASAFQYIFEIVSHDLPYEQAVSVMSQVKDFCIAGWTKVLE